MAGIAGAVEDGFAIALIQVRMFLRQNTGFAIAALRFASCPASAGTAGFCFYTKILDSRFRGNDRFVGGGDRLVRRGDSCSQE